MIRTRPREQGVQAPPQNLTRRVLTSRQTRVGLIMLVTMILFAIIGPFLTPHSPTAVIAKPYAPPGDGLLLGADSLGRDIVSRILSGGINLTWMGLAATAGGVILGTAIGLVAAFAGGIVDTLLMRVVDVLLTFPTIIMAILFISMVGPSRWILVVLVAIGLTPGMARVMRGAARPVMRREHVMWARTIGLSSRHILMREVLPSVTSPLMVEIGLRLMWSVVGLASLSFLGFGVQPPDADWGLMVSENKDGLAIQPLAVLIPAACVALFTIGGNLFAEGAARVIGRTEGARS
ncbi:peptide/nickel transport system permease protein [Actinomadura pelletieri DSM 43383]|uniref:Peptide/nickel transport system permease protein n=1 Tax=Actinomadura pelletieri DSM 43383 TaxID=1120940 RepID=A0A495QXP8_9ACTN|nr:ABC transporter permease [Actinomadura pelletieri]RKS78965.1 peptide/nickel transport system permease protein [Actinomadura pelletieri DSM 43383]